MEKVIFDIYMVAFKCIVVYIGFIMFDIYTLVQGNTTMIVIMVAFLVFIGSSFCHKIVKSSKIKGNKYSNKYHFHNN